MSDFFARPWLLIAAPLIYWLLAEVLRPAKQGGWADILPPELAKRLLTQNEATTNKPALVKRTWVLGLLTLLFTLVLAGVGYVLSTDQLPSEQQELVVIQHISPPVSGKVMSQRQLAISQRALIPLLNARKQGKTALVYYAASAHLVSPMTNDTATLRQLLSLTHPSVMPLDGHQPQAAFRLAASLGRQANQGQQGRLNWLWLTSELPSERVLKQLIEMKPKRAKLYLVWLDASLPLVEKQQAAFAKLGIKLLHPKQLAGYIAKLNRPGGISYEENQQPIQFFKELSHWPLLVALLLLLWQYFEQPRFKLSFKAGVGLLVFALGLVYQQPLQAAGWQNLDYQAWQAINAGEGKKAKKLAKRTDLKAHAEFLLGNYAKAAELFTLWQAETPTPDKKRQAEDLYNRGTAWLLAGQPKLALDDFKQAKDLHPDWPESCFNRELAKIQLAKQPLPTEQSLLKKCAPISNEESVSQPEETTSEEQAKDWQPEENASCEGCEQLDTTQEKKLQQLQEDPWALLKRRFKSELREQRP